MCGFIFSLIQLRSLLRYYFPGWHNKGSLLYAHRYGTAKGMESPVMDDCVMTYLFFQVGFLDLHLNIRVILL